MFLRLRLVESWVLGMYLNIRDSLGSILSRGFLLISTYSMLADKLCEKLRILYISIRA
jgi:hypothetical protein